MENNELIKCFDPIINNDCEIIFLGSIPSLKSRTNRFYYSNPTNRFWKLLSRLFNENFIDASNEEKKVLLLKNKIAMYDVYSSCHMKKEKSSLDSDITNYEFNDIPQLISGTKIRTIFITSKKAYIDFLKKFGKTLPNNIKIINLPSPSSANRSVYKSDEELYIAWKKTILENYSIQKYCQI